MENKIAIKKFIQSSLEEKELLTFYDWECPPRFLDMTKNRKRFINYDVNFKAIFLGKKIDNYTELPRCVQDKKTEISNLLFLRKLNIKFQYVKIIADTNVYLLTPDSLKILGTIKVQTIFNEFSKYLKQAVVNYPVKTKAVLFTDLLKPYWQEYITFYQKALKTLQMNPEKLIPQKIYLEQLKRTKDHMGFENKKQIISFTNRTIATYAAEGMVFDLLTRTTPPNNWIWLNLRETDTRTISISNCLRKQNNLGKLPMLFL